MPNIHPLAVADSLLLPEAVRISLAPLKFILVCDLLQQLTQRSAYIAPFCNIKPIN